MSAEPESRAEIRVTVTVTDLATGDSESRDVALNDYFIVTTGTCHIANIQQYPTAGTHVLTIKGRQGT